jgi:hypothetical protein
MVSTMRKTRPPQRLHQPSNPDGSGMSDLRAHWPQSHARCFATGKLDSGRLERSANGSEAVAVGQRRDRSHHSSRPLEMGDHLLIDATPCGKLIGRAAKQ